MGRHKIVRNYTDAREFVRGLGLKNVAEWYAFAASEKRPKDIPVSPWAAYKKYFKETGGKFSINDFIGAYATRGRPRKDENRQPKVVEVKVVEVQKSAYDIAKTIVQGLHLKNRAEFTEMSKNGNRPEGVPARPDLTFADEGWEGWATFLGNATPAKRELVNA